MATFGSLALYIALALAAYNLLAGIALRMLATGQPAPIAPERLADRARRAGIAGFSRLPRRHLRWSGRSLPTISRSPTSWSTPTARSRSLQICRAVERPGGFAAAVGWLLATYGFVLRLTHKTDVKLYAYAGTILAAIQVFFLAVVNFAAPPFALLRARFRRTATG